ncbi:hypothetical protein [Nocardia terpenica]|uniref:Uncharacterized protein n=1 Tax=Nocardia terpenica TaxID=455432 RepID=A0A291RPI9_9NOCA|nr:hypothetical protein [Nocardia terpenica]ATL69235.1 hypothetical protein CRH09_26720 [Nocardia terpenica]
MTTTSTGSVDIEIREAVAAQSHRRERYPARVVQNSWRKTRLSRVQVDSLVLSTSRDEIGSKRVRDHRRWGLPHLLDWFEDQPGDTWQDRWLASGADDAREDWAQIPEQWLRDDGRYSKPMLGLLTSSLLLVVGTDVIRPSLEWLLTAGKKRTLVRNMIYGRDRDGFQQLRQLCEQTPTLRTDAGQDIVFRSAVSVAAKGGALAEVTVGDVLEILDVERAIRGRASSAAATFRILGEAGIFGSDVPSLREIRSLGQRTIEQLVGRYPITCGPMRELLVDYLRERQPAIDYSRLLGLVNHLVRSFWFDLEQHHPGIDSLRLPREVAGAWKRRLRTKTTTVLRDGELVEIESERIGYIETLATIRAFYLDLADWALEDPTRWGPWVAPCPISQEDLSRRWFFRRRKARMDSRTRERLPGLPVLVETTSHWRHESRELLAVGTQTPPGQTFTAAGKPAQPGIFVNADIAMGLAGPISRCRSQIHCAPSSCSTLPGHSCTSQIWQHSDSASVVRSSYWRTIRYQCGFFAEVGVGVTGGTQYL